MVWPKKQDDKRMLKIELEYYGIKPPVDVLNALQSLREKVEFMEDSNILTHEMKLLLRIWTEAATVIITTLYLY